MREPWRWQPYPLNDGYGDDYECTLELIDVRQEISGGERL